MKKIIISAISKNNVIGSNNGIPWENEEELKFFKKTTLKHAVLMGRKTYDSIGKPLSERFNLVLSRSEKDSDMLHQLFYFTSISQALEYAENLEVKKTYIIGGSEIYSQLINEVDELLISRLPFERDGDKIFPEISSKVWELVENIRYDSFTVERYSKI